MSSNPDDRPHRARLHADSRWWNRAPGSRFAAGYDNNGNANDPSAFIPIFGVTNPAADTDLGGDPVYKESQPAPPPVHPAKLAADVHARPGRSKSWWNLVDRASRGDERRADRAPRERSARILDQRHLHWKRKLTPPIWIVSRAV